MTNVKHPTLRNKDHKKLTLSNIVIRLPIPKVNSKCVF